ncbi:MAG: hypothetical protein ABW321_13125 [Polyangiales bacterium]
MSARGSRFGIGAGLVTGLLASACSLDTAPNATAQGLTGSETTQSSSAVLEEDAIIESDRLAPAAGTGAAAGAAAPSSGAAGSPSGMIVASAGPSSGAAGAPPNAPERDAPEPEPEPDGATPAAPASPAPAKPVPSAAGAAAPPPAAEPAATSSRCKPGVYTGAFTGTIQVLALPVNSVTGTIRGDMVTTATKDQLALRDAQVRGVDQDGNDLTAVLTGTLNCVTGELENGLLERGSYHQADSTSTDTNFTGTANALYSVDPPSATGTWQATSQEIGLLGGQGTWTLTLSDSD